MIRIGSLMAHAVLLAGALLFMLPFMWMVLTSLKPASEFFDTQHILPTSLAGLEHYRRVLTDVPLLRFILNGVIVCGAILVLQLLVSLPCAYALAKLRFRGRGPLFAAILAAIVVPVQAPAIPLYVVFARVGLLDTYAALILPFVVSAFGIFLFCQVFRTFPDEILHAARLDGCNEWSIVWRILLPSSWPAIGAFAIISVIAHWNDLYWPLIVIITPDLATPPLGVMFFRSEELAATEYGALLAGGTMIIAPLLVAFLLARRTFLRGIGMTGPGRDEAQLQQFSSRRS